MAPERRLRAGTDTAHKAVRRKGAAQHHQGLRSERKKLHDPGSDTVHSENDGNTETNTARTTTAVVTHPLAPFGTGSAREPGFALTVTFRNDSPASAVAALIGSGATRAALSVLGRGVLGAGSAKLGLLAAASGVGLVAGITIARRLRGEKVGWREAIRDAVPATIEFGTEAVTEVREWWGRNEGESSATAWTVEPTGEGVRSALLEGARDEDGAWQCPYTGAETTESGRDGRHTPGELGGAHRTVRSHRGHWERKPAGSCTTTLQTSKW